jgi:hypothetical protein
MTLPAAGSGRNVQVAAQVCAPPWPATARVPLQAGEERTDVRTIRPPSWPGAVSRPSGVTPCARSSQPASAFRALANAELVRSISARRLAERRQDPERDVDGW